MHKLVFALVCLAAAVPATAQEKGELQSSPINGQKRITKAISLRLFGCIPMTLYSCPLTLQ
jgi:hypothetical protein